MSGLFSKFGIEPTYNQILHQVHKMYFGAKPRAFWPWLFVLFQIAA